MAELDPNFTFDTFVVGPANRLASAAARRAAESPGTSYNPLFLYSPSGLGKTHILGAIANQVERGEREGRVRYLTLERYLEDLTTALQRGERDQLREGYRDLDFLLLDDVQFLAGQSEAQEMILATLDGLTHTGSQIVLASDRPPAEINGLDARLVSRFSGGLIVDIAPPEFETRVAIIRKKAADSGQELEPGVAEALARVPFKNVRELGGALNRVLAVQELEERRLGPDDIAELVGVPPDEAPRLSTEPRGLDRELASFLTEVAGAVSEKVAAHEEPWRKAVRDVADQAEAEGFTAGKLRGLMRQEAAPPDWEERLAGFQEQIGRLREIDRELKRLRNPWGDVAATLVKDPERLDEAEAFLGSVRERMRPFPRLAPGPTLDDLEGHMPPLAIKSAAQLVTAEKPQYNPLYVWGPEAEAPRALMAAAGRTFMETFPSSTVAVTSVAGFAEDFIRALSEGVAGAWRERWWTVDLLMVQGAQDLADTERAQDEFFHLFEALKRRGARVLLTANRPPVRIDNIDDRLRSRFEGGLVLEAESSSLPEGAAVLELEEVYLDEGPARDSGWTGIARDVAPAVEGAEVDAPASDPTPKGTGATAAGRWRPSPENVVWAWPRMEVRLVEEFE
ncbi:MAG TPA: DnaA/Hda family protein [Longimicrobiales bacterium]|nr:DnaA/Hda family protein [Longimicrobiales bacterium]